MNFICYKRILKKNTSTNHPFLKIYMKKYSKVLVIIYQRNKSRNIVNDEVLDLVIDGIVNDKDFEQPETETESYESIEYLNYPQEY